MTMSVPRAALCLLSAVGLLAIAAVVPPSWPGRSYAEVRAYAFNLDGGFSRILADGELNPTVVDREGVVLGEDQVRRLVAAITDDFPEHPVARCFEPRHAFVFYNKARRPVATVDVCFECLGVESSPWIRPRPRDFPALADLCAELKLPAAPDPGFRKWFEDFRKEWPSLVGE